MQTRPIFQFDSLNSKGIDEVPVGGKVVVNDYENGHPVEVIKIAMGTLTSASNIAEFMADPLLFTYTGIQNNTTGTTGVVYQIWTGSQAEYTALGVYDPTILYFIRE